MITVSIQIIQMNIDDVVVGGVVAVNIYYIIIYSLV
jgi:hypothetical protein